MNQLANIRTSPQSVQEAKKALIKLERAMRSATTYESVKGMIGDAQAIKAKYRDVIAVKHGAEWTILVGCYQIGGQIKKVPLAARGISKNVINDKFRNGRGAIDIPHKRYYTQLGEIKEEKTIRKAAEVLWRADKDATMINVLREGLYGDFKNKRALREAELADKIKALPDKKYGVILADPEWKFKTHSEKGKVFTSAEKHYPTSDLADIKKRKPPAAQDCVLFLWGTVPMLPQALEVMEAWGFKYVSNVAWDKIKTGTGYWFMNQHEHLLVGTKGHVVPPAMGTQWPSIIRERSTGHSKKPEKSYKMIEEYFPNIPKVELNLRGKPRPGWDGWGNEAE